MQVGVIGYRNHAARMLSFLVSSAGVGRVVVYHPDHRKLVASGVQSRSPRIELASELSALFGLDAVLIASPSQTHVSYLKVLSDEVPYLYCEKPPASTQDELTELLRFDEARKRRIYFNFNYRRSELGKAAQGCLQTGRLGQPMHFQFLSSHGLAYRASFQGSWRAHTTDQLAGIFGNLAIHYLDLCTWLLGEPKTLSVNQAIWAGKSEAPDTVLTTMAFENRCTATIFVSYAAPFLNAAQLIFSDGVLEFNHNRLNLYAPREAYDPDGRFAQPPCTELFRADSSKAYYDESLRNSLGYFLSMVQGRGQFPLEEYEQSLRTNALIFHSLAGLVEPMAQGRS